jgi:hypothetical protein
MASKKNRSRKSLAVALAIVGVAGLSMASAAQLTITSDPVAAGVSVDSACDTAVAVSYGTAFSSGAYVVDEVTISSIDASCENLTLDFTLLDAGAAIANGTGGGVLGATGTEVYTLSPTVSAEDVDQIAVVIH